MNTKPTPTVSSTQTGDNNKNHVEITVQVAATSDRQLAQLLKKVIALTEKAGRLNQENARLSEEVARLKRQHAPSFN